MSSTTPMYAVAKLTDPPTVLEHVVYGRFLSSYERFLAVAGGNHIRIFRINREVRGKGTDGSITTSVKLECMVQFSVFGRIVSIGTALLRDGPDRDSLVIGCQDAKISIIQYDPEICDMQTVSLHSFEDELLKGGFTRDFPPPIVRVDPENRCLAMLVYGRHVGVVPLFKDIAYDDESIRSNSLVSPYHIPLTSYTFALDSFEDKIHNVRDMCFLSGYYEPTLLMLYEPTQSTSGRVAMRMDTCCICAISLNVKERIHAVVWSVASLPLDCWRLQPIPKPISGVLVFGVDEIIHLNQSVPPFGVSVNSNLNSSTHFPLHNREELMLALDQCTSDFLTPKQLVISLNNGDLYVLTLIVDNLNCVKNFHFDQAAHSVITSAIVHCERGLIFLASRMGNSLLLKYGERGEQQMRITIDEGSTAGMDAIKRARFDPTAGDDVDLYGEVVALRTEAIVRIPQYWFEVCDSLLNFGPLRHITIGEPAHIPQEYNQNPDPILDFVFTAGYSKNGALTLFQRTVRPHLVTSIAIPDALQIWTVGKFKTADEEEGVICDAQKYLIISKTIDTMVLEMRADIAELESSGFAMDRPTIAAGNLMDDELIVQVCPMQTFLLNSSGDRIEELELKSSYPVAQASIQDPYVALLLENGELRLLQVENGHLTMRNIRIAQDIPASAITVFKDESGLFGLAKATRLKARQFGWDSKMRFPPEEIQVVAVSNKGLTDGTFASGLKQNMTADDEDFLLYGESSTAESKPDKKPKMETEDENEPAPEITNPTATFWLAVCRENGLLEIFQLPDFTLAYMVRKFPMGARVLTDTDPVKASMEPDRVDDLPMGTVKEICMVGLGANKGRVLLIAAVAGDLYVYEAFPYYGDKVIDGHLAVRFRKVQHEIVLKNHKYMRTSKKQRDRTGADDSTQNLEFPSRLFFPFADVGGYSGVFVSGPYPHWMLMTTQGILRCHPMSLDGYVHSMAPFHNVNCPSGFLYMTSNHELRIAQIPAHISYDASCPVHKVALKATGHFVEYLLDSKAYAVASSTKKPLKTMVSIVGDEKSVDTYEKEGDPHFLYPLLDQFQVDLFDPETFQPIPGTTLEMFEYERVTVLKEVQLKSEGTMSGLQSYLAMGTLSNYGEDVMCRGRILICEVIEVVPEPGQPLTKYKIKQVYAKEQKGPVTSMCSVQGYLLTGMGQKLYIWQFKDNDLDGISFLDMHFYIHQLVAIKNLILMADVFKSISFLRYQESHRALSLVSRDLRPTPVEIFDIEFMVDNRQLAFLASDGDANLLIYMYQPEAKEALGGTRLLRRGDFNMGCRISALYRLRSHIGDPVVEQKLTAVNRHMNLFGTLDGGLGFVMPLPEKTYRRLFMLQNVLSQYLQHYAGLNPKAYRACRFAESGLNNAQKNIVDGDLIYHYRHLSLPERIEVSRRIGTTNEQILDDLLELQRLTTHY